MALPASIVENAQGGELKALLVGQMARALTIYGVDEAMGWGLWIDVGKAAWDDGRGI